MARKRPWYVHREVERAYTRFSYRKTKNFILGAPPSRVRMLVMGKRDTNPKDWKYAGHLISLVHIQVSDSALEAVRILLNKYLERKIKEYLFMVRVYPHHVVREHPIAFGAGADRISQGMRLSFGKPMRRAAQLYPGRIVFSVYFNKEVMNEIKDYLRIARNKLTGNYIAYVGENIDEKEILKAYNLA
jgi:large subunit ribosomal protein L10e